MRLNVIARVGVIFLLGLCAGCGKPASKPATDALPVLEPSSPAPAGGIVQATAIAAATARLCADPLLHGAEIRIAPELPSTVRLSGFVDSAAAKLRAGEIVEQTFGATITIDNRLILRGATGIAKGPLAHARIYL